MPLVTHQTNFPVGFAEITPPHDPKDTEYYVEWLDNDGEFPGLSSNTAKTITDDNWELLEQKGEFNDWSKVYVFDVNSYAEIAEKNADELKPTKRTIQPLWPTQQKSEKVENNDDLSEDDLDLTSLYYLRKGQGKQTIRDSHLHRKKLLRTVDHLLFPGIYIQGTSEFIDQVFFTAPPERGECYPFASKREALKFIATLNVQHAEVYPLRVWRNKLDNSEYSALHAQKERYRNKDE